MIRNNFTYINNSLFNEYFSDSTWLGFGLWSYLGISYDCDRTVPILIHLPLDSLFDDLPVLLLYREDIHQIATEYLNQKYIEIMSRKDEYNFKYLRRIGKI